MNWVNWSGGISGYDWLMDWNSLVWSWSICSMTFIGYFSNVSRVSVSGVVCYSLSTAVWKEDTVLTLGRITIALFILTKVGSTVVVLHSIFVSIYWWSVFIYWPFSINWSWVDWSWVI